MFNPGDRLEIRYPTNTHVRSFEVAQRRPRYLKIRWVRDLVKHPLTPAEFMRRPFVMRSRWLVSVWDLEANEIKQFYPGSADEFLSPGKLRIALYEPGATIPHDILEREFDPTVVDRRAMIRLLADWDSSIHPGLHLRILSDNFRVIA